MPFYSALLHSTALCSAQLYSILYSNVAIVCSAIIIVFFPGLKEKRLKQMTPIHTGRYFEATVARGEEVQDLDAMHSLRIDNLSAVTT